MSRSNIAEYSGLTIETVMRTLTCLRHESVTVMLGPSHIMLQDRRQLERLAEAETDQGRRVTQCRLYLLTRGDFVYHAPVQAGRPRSVKSLRCRMDKLCAGI